jgi:penicillin-insensitive murein endopeptidase
VGKGDASKAKGGEREDRSRSARPTRGACRARSRLKGAKQLKQREGAHSWALAVDLVHLLERASLAVAKKHKGAVLLVGDLSGRTGGPLDGHGSHQTGRDADVAFYAMNSKGKPLPLDRIRGLRRERARRGSSPGTLLRRRAELGAGRGAASPTRRPTSATCS